MSVLLLALSAQTWAQTLEDTIRITLRTNPDVLASLYSVDAAEELKNQARGAYFPSIDLVLAGGYENSNNTTTRALGEDDIDLTRSESSIRVTQLLFDGASTRNFVRQQSALVDAALARLVGTQENVGLRAIQVYLEVLRRNEIVRLAERNLAHHDETLEKITERFESGVGTKVDVVQTRGRRAQAKSNVLLSQREAKNGVAEYFRVVGEYPEALSLPAAVESLPQTLEEALELAKVNNPGIEAVEAELAATEAARKGARGAFYPRFDLELGATRNDDLDGSEGANDDETAVVRMTYNLYRGGSDRARLNEAEAREFAARESLRSTQRAVEEDVTLIWNELQDILVRLEYLDAHVKATEEVLEVYREQLTLGKRTLLDLLDVQNELLRAQIAKTTGDYVALLARYRVLAGTGQLLDTLEIDPERS
ncbi:MAG: TolC family outer membrane protein [Pseudomonadales bacterium]|nr:TolC family outer membrane protein [Pseudomonadales bacterium]MBO6595658.1 TolC family outer membrane protein [Pseudomonadales bacterium]MBO6655727.1 TolC family outer membrane protein [Pseudomonadales bacterium]MBO6702158.1 TolC family outer membrane protein [Pseudomonadales bacterium]MBO7007324.1 TolC family outer membrane protein [Pseudomonadales bacterium]